MEIIYSHIPLFIRAKRVFHTFFRRANEWLILKRRNKHGIWSMISMPVSLARANGWNGMNTSLDAKFTPTIKLHLERGRDVPHLMPFFKRPHHYPSNLCPWPPPPPIVLPHPQQQPPSRKGKRNRRRNSRPHRVNVYTFAFVAPAKSARHAPVNNIIGYHRLFDTTPSCIQVSTIIFQPRAKISSSIFHWNEGANSFF